MKYLICFLLTIGSFGQLFCQVNDTVQDMGTDCIGQTKSVSSQNGIKYVFWNDNISISGFISANCCGSHYLKRQIINDSIFLTAIDSGLCNCICDYSFSTELQDCSLDKYKLFINHEYIQEIRRYDTMSYVTSSCISESEIDYNLSYSGDTIIFYGIIEANCGGTHLLLYDINVDTINLYRLDTGELEDCMCLYEFEAKFVNCTKDNYKVLLDDEYGQGIDTTVSKTTSLIESQFIDNKVLYPNPTNGFVNIDWNDNISGKVQIRIYDNSGKLIHSEMEMLAEENIEIDLTFLQTGIYIMRIIGENNSKSLKLIKE